MKSLHYLILFLVAVACTEISYKTPQPRGKKSFQEIPSTLRGKYLLQDEKSSERDTLVVTSKGYFFSSDSTKNATDLSDSLVMKSYKGYYFFNKNEDVGWILRVLRQDKNGDLHYLSMETTDENFNSLLKKVGAKIEIDSSTVDGKKRYQIDPSPRELIGLIKDGLFKEEMSMKKIK